MSDPADTVQCRQCGTQFSGKASPLGVCPACLLKLGLSDPSWTTEASDATGDEQGETPGAAPPAPAAVAAPGRHGGVRVGIGTAALLVGVTAVTVVAAVAWTFLLPPAPRGADAGRVFRFTLPLPEGAEVIDGAQIALSPDGRQVALSARSPGGQPLLWVRSFDATAWRPLEATAGATLPFWSPDGRHLGFFAERSLKRIEVSSGLTSTLADASSGRGGTWGADGVVLFAHEASGPLWRLPASGGSPQQVATTQEGVFGLAWPHALPGSGHVLYVAVDGRPHGEGPGGTTLISLDSGEQRLLVPGGGAAAFARGLLVYIRDSSLVAQSYDRARHELTGDPHLLPGAEPVAGTPRLGWAFAATDDVLVYRTRGTQSSSLEWFDRNGGVVGSALDPAHYEDFSLSPDGRRVAAVRVEQRDNSSSIWLLDLERQGLSRLTMAPGPASSPRWSPDGTRLVFASIRDGSSVLVATDATGGGKEQILLSSPEPGYLSVTDWSPDGRSLIVQQPSPETGSDLWMLPVAAERKPVALLTTSSNESDGRLSPDGRWLAYVSDMSGRDEVYVTSFPSIEGTWQISTGGATLPRWRRDGREFFFASPEGLVMAVEVEPLQQAFRVGQARPLFQARGAIGLEAARDGRRFLLRSPVSVPGETELNVVLNWAADLGR